MAPKVTAIRGIHDVRPGAPEGYDIAVWRKLENAAVKVFGAYGYDEIRTPLLERTELFARSIGAATDVVEKEMYTFTDKGGDSVTLRPEGTAGVVRAYVEHGIAANDPSSRFWYRGPMFRYERPQKGRYRQFWQIGAELFGQRSARVDAEVLGMLRAYLDELGIRGVAFHVASLGDAKCRPTYRAELTAFLKGVADQLCDDCTRRIETNPMRVLDCKKEGCRAATAKAPVLMDRLCEECGAHFAEVKRNLDLLGVAYQVDPRIVRGLDYYVRTTFELIHTGEGGTDAAALGAQNAVGGGGRYDGLVKELGGPDLPGVGFGLGVERLVLVLQAQSESKKRDPFLFIAAVGQAAGDRAMALARDLRARGLQVELDYENKPKGLGNMLDRANKRHASLALIVGDEELAKGSLKIKDLRSGTQEDFGLSDAAALATQLMRSLEK